MVRMYAGVCFDCAPHACGHADMRFLGDPDKQRAWLDDHHDQGHRAMIAEWPVHDSLSMTIGAAVLGFMEAAVAAGVTFEDLQPAPDWKTHAAFYKGEGQLSVLEIADAVGRHIDTVTEYLEALPEGEAGEPGTE